MKRVLRKIKKLGNFLIRKFKKKMFSYLRNFQKLVTIFNFNIYISIKKSVIWYFFLFFFFQELKFLLTWFWSILIYREFFYTNRVESARQSHEEQPSRQHPASNNSTSGHEHLMRRNHSEVSERENDVSYRARPRPRTHHYAMERPAEQEVSRPRPRSFYENPTVGRDFREQRNVADPREVMIPRFLFPIIICSFGFLPWNPRHYRREIKFNYQNIFTSIFTVIDISSSSW